MSQDETRERLLDAAGEVFADKGFEAATVREICTRAGTNIAAINYHFGDKERLYLEAVKAAHCAQLSPEPFSWPPGTPAERKLRDFLQAMVTDMVEEGRGWHVGLLMREMARPTAACAELVRSFIGPKFAQLLEILDELLPAGLPLIERHRFAFSIVGQCLIYRFHRPVGRLLVGEEEFQRLFDVERLTEHIARFSLAGLRSAAAAEAKS